MIYKTIDLCAGIGGIRRGFEMTGAFENVLSAEIDPAAAATYKHLFNEDPTNDLTSEDFKNKVVSIDYDVLLAGFPCQAFSRIGKQLGFRDSTRGTIFFEIADIISRTNPRAVFLENVENLVSHDQGNTIAVIIKTLEEELGYRVLGVAIDDNGNYEYSRSSLVRNTKRFGLPQNRPRVYLMAFSKKKYGKAIRLLNKQLPKGSEEIIFDSVLQILEDTVDDKYYMAEGYLNTLKRHKERNHNNGNGFGYCVINQEQGIKPIANTILATGGSGKERNLVYQPKEGIAGKRISGKRTVLNSEGIRMMTPKEWGRLQGFVDYAFLDENGIDHFSFPEGTTDGQKYKQLGNSVSIPVIKSMALFMLECFKTLEKEQEEVIKALAENNEYFTKRDVMELLDLNAQQTSYLVRKMIEANKIKRISCGKTTRYMNANAVAILPPFSQEEKVLKFAEERLFFSNEDIKEYLNAPSASVNVLLSKMVKEGKIIRVSRGRYCIK